MEGIEKTVQQIATFMSMDDLAKKIQEALTTLNPNGYVKAYFSNSICDSICIRFSLEKKENWPGGYYENTKYSTCHVWNVTQSGRVLQRVHTGLYGFESGSGRLRPRNKKVCKNEEELLKHIITQFTKLVEVSSN